MHEHKLPEFNPLDLLATAASLQCQGRGVTSGSSPVETPAMRRDNGPARRTRSSTALANAVDNTKLKSKKLENDLKIYKVVVKNELSKMLEEHNYGHPKRNFRYGYILDDEPFSSDEKELDCNEYRDCVKGSPDWEGRSPSDLSPDRHRDNNCNTLSPDKQQPCVEIMKENNEKVLETPGHSHTEHSVEEVNGDVVNSDSCEKDVQALPALAVLDSTSGCPASVLPVSDDGEKLIGRLDGFPEVRHVDRIESCDDETALVDVETVSVDNKPSEQVTSLGDKPQGNSQDDTPSTLDGFIVSDPCHSCESVDYDSETGPKMSESTDKIGIVNCSNVGSDLDESAGHASVIEAQSDTAVPNSVGNMKKQTIIRSLLTGETIVVVQKSPNGSTELGKFPLLVDSSQTLRRRLNEKIAPLQTDSRLPEQSSEVLGCSAEDKMTVSPLEVEQLNSSKTDISTKSISELSDIEMARQQNIINSNILAGKDKPSGMAEISHAVVSPDKKPSSPTSLIVPVPSAPQVDSAAPQTPSAHSSLLSKLSSGISQRKGHIAPVSVPSNASEQFNIGRFASVSSSKIGLVRVKAIPKTPGSVTTTGRKGPGKGKSYENAAYQEVIKQYPKLAKACKDDELLKMAVAPDDVLQCLPTVPTRIPTTDHVHHDHDYCVKGSPSVAALLAGGGRLLHDIDREPKLGRPPKNADRRRKYVRKKAEGASSRANSPLSETPTIIPSPVEAVQEPDLKVDTDFKLSGKRRSSRPKSGRDSSPGDTVDSPEVEGDGTKVKITGAFQDDFVYFINKTSRNRRRTSEQPSAPVLPVVQASDIYIPHLSDADIAALKDKHVAGTERNSGQTNINDEDSKVINTILSLESSIGQEDSQSADSFAFSGTAGDSLNGVDFTQEQMDLIFSAIAKYKGGLEQEFSSVTPGEVSPVKSSPDSEPDNSFPDEGSQLLGNEDNIHEPNMDLILSDASNMKTYLPTLDATDVQDSISAIASTSAETGLSCETVTVDSSVASPHPGQYVPPGEQEPRKAPASGMCDLSLPSIEKSLDLLGVADMRTDLFPDMSLHVPEVTSSSPVTSETNSPWIVTVSMYWNDLPAIMLGNLPYVRLVDIYKQILPAKDTGILKKRCQLLGVEVKNCSEMQRYFIVKYGRGYNSKSTLVVSKDDAMRLIAFYVEPQSRVPNTGKGSGEKMSSSSSPTPRPRKHSVMSETSCDSVNSGSTASGTNETLLGDEDSSASKKEKPKSGGPRTPSRRRLSLIPDAESVARRLRHKKINFRNMIQGIKREEEVVEGESPMPAAAPTETAQPAIPSPKPQPKAGPSEPGLETVVPFPEPPVKPSTETITDSVPDLASVPIQQPLPSRSTSKPSRPHAYAVVKQRPLRTYSVLGKQLRRAKGNFHNGTLQNVLKKRQLNGAVQKLADSAELKGKRIVEPSVDGKPLLVQESEQESKMSRAPMPPTGVRRLSSRRHGLCSAVSSDIVRSSGRKRKLKQLYPIENYSYAKKQKKTVRVQSSRQTRSFSTPLRTSPRKKRAEMSSRIDTEGIHAGTSSRSTSEDEENRPKNVITLTNGPEFETFTALTGEFGI